MHTETEEYAPVTVDTGQPAHPDVSSRTTLLAISFQFVRRHWLALPSISVFLLIPCFWHRYIVAGDLDSHVYNAWLVQLIEQDLGWLFDPIQIYMDTRSFALAVVCDDDVLPLMQLDRRDSFETNAEIGPAVYLPFSSSSGERFR